MMNRIAKAVEAPFTGCSRNPVMSALEGILAIAALDKELVLTDLTHFLVVETRRKRI